MIDRDELLEHYHKMRAALVAAVEGLSDAQLSEPSLDGWSVKDHLTHLAAWDEIRASEIERISAGHATAWRMKPEHEEAINAVLHELRGGLSVEQAKWESAASHQRVLDAIASATEHTIRAILPNLLSLRGRAARSRDAGDVPRSSMTNFSTVPHS